jgi:hypothetical protein
MIDVPLIRNRVHKKRISSFGLTIHLLFIWDRFHQSLDNVTPNEVYYIIIIHSAGAA